MNNLPTNTHRNTHISPLSCTQGHPLNMCRAFIRKFPTFPRVLPPRFPPVPMESSTATV